MWEFPDIKQNRTLYAQANSNLPIRIQTVEQQRAAGCYYNRQQTRSSPAADTTLWIAHPKCPEHVKTGLETCVQSFTPSFLLAPIGGEVFENADVSQERLEGGPIAGLRHRLNR
jgi:hypothetical protein